MNGDILRHIAEQATLIEILCARIEELENENKELIGDEE